MKFGAKLRLFLKTAKKNNNLCHISGKCRNFAPQNRKSVTRKSKIRNSQIENP